MKFFIDFYLIGKVDKKLNSSFITLISKKECPEGLGDSRPISLIGSIYKILAKVLANRLRVVMSSKISENQ